MKNHLSLFAVVTVMALILAACPAPPAAPTDAAQPAGPAAAGSDQAVYTTVVKLIGVNWFNRMEEGVKKFGGDNAINASLVGPEKADAALQIPIIEDLIAPRGRCALYRTHGPGPT